MRDQGWFLWQTAFPRKGARLGLSGRVFNRLVKYWCSSKCTSLAAQSRAENIHLHGSCLHSGSRQTFHRDEKMLAIHDVAPSNVGSVPYRPRRLAPRRSRRFRQQRKATPPKGCAPSRDPACIRQGLRTAPFRCTIKNCVGPVAQRLEQRTHKPDHFSDLF